MLSRFAAVLAATASSAVLAEIKVEHVRYTSGEMTMEGVIAFDAAVTEKRPGILVCPGGGVATTTPTAAPKQLAALGYVAFAADLYGNGRSTDPKQATEWAGAVNKDPKEMRARAAAALAVLAKDPHTDSSKLAVIGYCMGGTVALELARSGLPNTENLKAIVAFHASTIAAKDPPTARTSRARSSSARQDDSFVEQITDFHKQMKEIQASASRFISFANSVHAFTNPEADKFGIQGIRYNEKADKRSWAAMRNLFHEVFGTGMGHAKPADEKK